MDQLIDLIFDNLFFVIIIVGAIFSLFKGNDNKGEQQEQLQKQQRQQVKTSPDVRKPAQPQHVNTYAEKEKAVVHLSVEEHRAEQMKQLGIQIGQSQASMGKGTEVNPADGQRSLEINDLTSNYNHQEFKGSFKESLTREGLVNSVVMAEVLGAPRARNPYKSVIAKRRA